MSEATPNFAGFYAAWTALKRKSGAAAEIRRAATMDDLLDLPAFYRLVEPFGWRDCTPWQKQGWQRLVFLVNHVTDKGDHSLGQALAQAKSINEKRIYQVVRADSPTDITQLRRLLIQAEPELCWNKMARQLWFWGLRQKRNLLEDFILNQKDKH